MADNPKTVVQVQNLTVYYDGVPAVKNVSFDVYENQLTALIGRSGSGKSTVIRDMNRMNETLPEVVVTRNGDILYRGHSIYGKRVLPEIVRRHLGMVFQKPNPFPKSIFENVVYGLRLIGKNDKDELMAIAQQCLEDAELWKDVRTRMKMSGLKLSLGQQQRLCFARMLALKPDVLLLDEPTASLDPVVTRHIMEYINAKLIGKHTIVMVVHDLALAAKADQVVFFAQETDKSIPDPENRPRWGEVVEWGSHAQIFGNPRDKRTREYVSNFKG
jgi:phosphate transport system ATP-binding protein